MPLVLASLLCVMILLCVHQFAAFAHAGGSAPGPVVEHSSHPGSVGGIGGYQTQPVGSVPASLEEVEASGADPVNAQSLTALLLVVFFGAGLGLLFGGRRSRRDAALLISWRKLPSITRHLPSKPTPSSLSTFLL